MFNPGAQQTNFYLCVIHVATNTITWTANHDGSVSNSGTMSLTNNGILITDQNGNSKWSTPPLQSLVSVLQLTESGNLILLDHFNGTLWESFSYPTDTIVIGQKLHVGTLLSSSVSSGDLSIGDYRLSLSTSDAFLMWQNMTYWKLSMDTMAYRNSNFPVEYMAINRTGLYLFGQNSTVIVIQELAGPVDKCQIPFICGRLGLCSINAALDSPNCEPGHAKHGFSLFPTSYSLGDLDAYTIPGLPMRFEYAELEAATDYFKNWIGSGRYGSVYKGLLPDKSLVAVKKISSSGVEGNKYFCTEIEIIGNIHHVNLVKLRGFCAQGSERLLVYEYMNGGSLDRTLFGNGPVLKWQERVDIALGTARGLAYLHCGCQQKIIHCDIKPENILLHDNSHAKISDFGLSRLLSPEQSTLYTTMRGTRGYLAPEWLTSSAISDKADVYSFGMVLLEIMLEQGRYLELAYPRLEGRVSSEEVERLVSVALCCAHEEPALRPSMVRVVSMLEGEIPLCRPRLQSLNFLRYYGQRLADASTRKGSNGHEDFAFYPQANAPLAQTRSWSPVTSFLSSTEIVLNWDTSI
ncbi:hypothetical protein RHSIM_RhsimUnG0095300 [Rhododendron simsii]|uniref:Uncharacterized protein n=1 Tax=Rhododendron simsii TaxID=118357 RepID=A0A834FXM5_RHOSS|nr:hypothetical protein RHSIM_RhsimUnG0095300 [Rhododendron simsii]